MNRCSSVVCVIDNSLLLPSGGKATGVRLRPANSKKPPTVIKTRKGVVSNASVWDTQTLLPNQDITPKQEQWSAEAKGTPQTGSFMHLHLGLSSSAAFHPLPLLFASP